MGLEDVGDAVAESQDGHAPAVGHGVEERLHLGYPLALVDDLGQRGAPSHVQRDQAASQLIWEMWAKSVGAPLL